MYRIPYLDVQINNADTKPTQMKRCHTPPCGCARNQNINTDYMIQTCVQNRNVSRTEQKAVTRLLVAAFGNFLM